MYFTITEELESYCAEYRPKMKLNVDESEIESLVFSPGFPPKTKKPSSQGFHLKARLMSHRYHKSFMCVLVFIVVICIGELSSDESILDVITKSKYDRCKLDPKGPTTAILISKGRSGSSVLWDTLSRLSGDATVAHEVTGGNRNSSREFFENVNQQVDWATKRLCNIQRKYMHDEKKGQLKYALVGFQWKPFHTTFDHPMAIAGMKVVSDQNFKVIHLTRNPLDRYLSNLKHRGKQHSKEVPAHCKTDDLPCIKNHETQAKGISIELSTGEEKEAFIEHLRESRNSAKVYEERLDTFGIKHIHVYYEALFDHEARDEYLADEWMRIFKFLGIGPQNDLTMGDVRNSFEYASTSPKSHKEIISNFKEVKKVLSGTDLIDLLH